MSANSGAHGVKGGFNQSGGSYFMVLSNLEDVSGVAVHTYVINAAASKSGGAFEAPTFSLTNMATIMKSGGTYAGLANDEAAAFVNKGALLKDLGKTVVAANGRTYRKFQLAPTGTQFVNSFGVAGSAAAAPNTGYASFYLDVTRDSGSVLASATVAPAPILRCF